MEDDIEDYLFNKSLLEEDKIEIYRQAIESHKLRKELLKDRFNKEQLDLIEELIQAYTVEYINLQSS